LSNASPAASSRVLADRRYVPRRSPRRRSLSAEATRRVLKPTCASVAPRFQMDPSGVWPSMWFEPERQRLGESQTLWHRGSRTSSDPRVRVPDVTAMAARSSRRVAERPKLRDEGRCSRSATRDANSGTTPHPFPCIAICGPRRSNHGLAASYHHGGRRFHIAGDSIREARTYS